MKKIIAILGGIALTVAVTVFAANGFTDQKSFKNWYKNAVVKLNSLGIINGYPDGSFRPENNVNRAELAVMLSKYDDYRVKNFDDLLATKLMAFMSAQRQFANLDTELAKLDEPSWYKDLIIIAETGLKRLNRKPSNVKLESNLESLTTGYSIYMEQSFPKNYYYVHYKGLRAVTDIMAEVDEWYGPF